MTEAYLGCAYTDPDGSYDFEFDFSYKNSPWIWSVLFADKIPDIRARVSQFVDGLWTQIYEGPVDWDIAEDFHRDYFIPIDDVIPVPPEPSKPLTDFSFISVGLLPIDASRIQLGYATADPLDPYRISTISHQPFCGRLRIFGLFGEIQLFVIQRHSQHDRLHFQRWVFDEGLQMGDEFLILHTFQEI